MVWRVRCGGVLSLAGSLPGLTFSELHAALSRCGTRLRSCIMCPAPKVLGTVYLGTVQAAAQLSPVRRLPKARAVAGTCSVFTDGSMYLRYPYLTYPYHVLGYLRAYLIPRAGCSLLLNHHFVSAWRSATGQRSAKASRASKLSPIVDIVRDLSGSGVFPDDGLFHSVASRWPVFPLDLDGADGSLSLHVAFSP